MVSLQSLDCQCLQYNEVAEIKRLAEVPPTRQALSHVARLVVMLPQYDPWCLNRLRAGIPRDGDPSGAVIWNMPTITGVPSTYVEASSLETDDGTGGVLRAGSKQQRIRTETLHISATSSASIINAAGCSP